MIALGWLVSTADGKKNLLSYGRACERRVAYGCYALALPPVVAVELSTTNRTSGAKEPEIASESSRGAGLGEATTEPLRDSFLSHKVISRTR
jgi:hypothetical protein